MGDQDWGETHRYVMQRELGYRVYSVGIGKDVRVRRYGGKREGERRGRRRQRLLQKMSRQRKRKKGGARSTCLVGKGITGSRMRFPLNGQGT